jgi:hypothetical protein
LVSKHQARLKFYGSCQIAQSLIVFSQDAIDTAAIRVSQSVIGVSGNC